MVPSNIRKGAPRECAVAEDPPLPGVSGNLQSPGAGVIPWIHPTLLSGGRGSYRSQREGANKKLKPSKFQSMIAVIPVRAGADSTDSTIPAAGPSATPAASPGCVSPRASTSDRLKAVRARPRGGAKDRGPGRIPCCPSAQSPAAAAQLRGCGSIITRTRAIITSPVIIIIISPPCCSQPSARIHRPTVTDHQGTPVTSS